MSVYRHFLFILVFLAACSPILKTTYTLSKPESEEGKLCAENCLQIQRQCSGVCRLEQSRCEMNERLKAQGDYLGYSQNRQTQGIELKKNSTNFDTTYRCRDTACVPRCEETQRQCHTNCGGEVTGKTECTAFCDNK